MATVKHKNKTFSGTVLGVEFDKGEAEVNLPGHVQFFELHEDFETKGEAQVEKLGLDGPVLNPGA